MTNVLAGACPGVVTVMVNVKRCPARASVGDTDLTMLISGTPTMVVIVTELFVVT